MNFLDVILAAVIIFMVLRSTSKVEDTVFDRNSTAERSTGCQTQ